MTPSGPVLFETPRLRLRSLERGDEALLQEVFAAAGDYFLSITGRAAPDPDAAAREIAAAGSIAGRRVALLEPCEAGEAVGALGWWEAHPEPDTALLGMLLVVPALRGTGLGREAIAGLEGWLRSRGVRRVRTAVGAGDAARHALLVALGFVALDQRRHVSLDRGRVMLAFFEKPVAGVDATGGAG